MFSGDVLTASRCGSAQTVTYFLPFFSLSLSFSLLTFSVFSSPPSFRSGSFCLSVCLLFLPSSSRFFQGVVVTFQLLNNGAWWV